MKSRTSTCLLLLLVFFIKPCLAAYQDGLDAYNAGDFQTAMYEWKNVIATPSGELSPATYAEARYAIGMLYWMGQGVPVDYPEASRWLHQAAELGHAGAQGKLGYLYTSGITVQQSYPSAFEWFSKAAKQGDVDAQYNLGIFYLNGWGTEKDTTMAAQYLAAASALGDKDAEAALQELLAFKRTGSTTGISAEAGASQASQSPNPTLLIHPATWILDQPPSHYTIQVIALREKEDLQHLIKNHPELAPWATYSQIKNSEPIHVLIQGNYATVDAARNAQAQFPKSIQPPENTWIRKFEKIQTLINP